MGLLVALPGSAGRLQKSPLIGVERKHLLGLNFTESDPTETWATLASRSAKLNYCTPFRWSQFLFNWYDARESASLTRVKYRPARQCDCRRGGAADKARG